MCALHFKVCGEICQVRISAVNKNRSGRRIKSVFAKVTVWPLRRFPSGANRVSEKLGELYVSKWAGGGGWSSRGDGDDADGVCVVVVVEEVD